MPPKWVVDKVYAILINTYGVKTDYYKVQQIIQPDSYTGQQNFNYVLNTMQGVWPSMNDAVNFEQVEAQYLMAVGDVPGGGGGAGCHAAARRVQITFGGIAAGFGILAIALQPALAVSGAASLVVLAATAVDYWYC